MTRKKNIPSGQVNQYGGFLSSLVRKLERLKITHFLRLKVAIFILCYGSFLHVTIKAEEKNVMLPSVVPRASRGKVRTLVSLIRRRCSAQPGSSTKDETAFLTEAKQRRPSADPGAHSVLLFPGQGSQFVGMGRGLLKYPNVREMFRVAQKILGYDLLSLCSEGPPEELMKTVHCQPAVFVTSLAAVEKLNHENPKVGP